MQNNAQVKFGILLPTREAVMSGRSDPSIIFQLAERAEALGFHSVWVGDSLTARPRVEALTTLAAVGARTRRVRLGTSVFLAALRHPILLAHQLASLDWLTGGRIDLGIGYGRAKEPTQEHEFEILGLSAGARIKMSEELVQVMRRLWRENDAMRYRLMERSDRSDRSLCSGRSEHRHPALRRARSNRPFASMRGGVTSPRIAKTVLKRCHL